MIKAIDFFCGAGGLTRGLLDAGFTVLAGVDNDEKLKKTYEANNFPSQFIREDIRMIRPRSLRKKLGINHQDTVLYAACTPCQPFSTLNQRHGRDDRKNLLLAFGEIIQVSPPDFVLVENVPGLNTAFGKSVFSRFRKILRAADFRQVYAEFLDAKDFGVPQTRKRFILLASRRGEITAPEHSPLKLTVRDAIQKYPCLRDGEQSSHVPNHVARRLKPHHKRIVRAIPKDGGSRRDIANTSILLKCHRENPDVHKDVFGRMAWLQPAPTLTCRCTDVYCGRFVHPDQNRGISLREAAALQTFDDTYVFHGDYVLHIAQQIGNAVPVKFAQALGKAIISSI